MKSHVKNLISFHTLLLAMVSLVFLPACDDDDDNDAPVNQGDVQFEITDAPIDDANVEAVYVTISDIRIDGESFDGFSGKQTVNLLALQEGNTEVLGTGELNTGTYSDVTLVLDYETDDAGSAPGSYVLLTDGTKVDLSEDGTGSLDIDFDNNFDVDNIGTTRIIIDFNLRQAIRRNDNPDQPYRFVSDDELENAVRIVTSENTGTISGTYSESILTDADRVVVYVYEEGTFNESTETIEDGEGRLFTNAIASSVIDTDVESDDYTIAFLEEGNYELHFVTYDMNDGDEVEFGGLLDSELTIDGTTADVVDVQAGTETAVTTTIVGPVL